MRTYALAAWLILCAGVRIAAAQDPDAWSDEPFLIPGAVEQIGRLEDTDGEAARREAMLEQLRQEYGTPSLIPELESPEPDQDELSFQYPLDQDDYRPPAPEQPARSWVPPVLRHKDQTTEPAVGWLKLKSTKVAFSQLGSSGSLGITTIQLRPTIEIPRAPGIFVTPNFGWHFLGGPSTTDLPPRLQDYLVDFSMYRPIGNWLVQVAVMPGIFTDGQNTTSDALRIQGKLMGFYTMSPRKKLVLGVVYLDRQDVLALPTFGLILQPRDDLTYELLFPKPRLAWRQFVRGDWEQWVYATGELGGGSWAVRRTSGLNDIATYRDLRFLIGLERKHTSSRSWYVEGGYVFARRLEFQSNIGNVTFDETAFLRVGGAF